LEQRYPHEDILAALEVAVQHSYFDAAVVDYLLHSGKAASVAPSVTPTSIHVPVEERPLATYDVLNRGAQ
jgi:hypothetical protein